MQWHEGGNVSLEWDHEALCELEQVPPQQRALHLHRPAGLHTAQHNLAQALTNGHLKRGHKESINIFKMLRK